MSRVKCPYPLCVNGQVAVVAENNELTYSEFVAENGFTFTTCLVCNGTGMVDKDKVEISELNKSIQDELDNFGDLFQA